MVIAKSRARHVHVMSLTLLASRKSPLISPKTTDECSSFRIPKRFRFANAVYKVMQSLKITQGHLVDQNFLQRYTRNFDIRRRVLRVKKMTKFKKNTHISLSLLVDLSMYFDFPKRMCMYQSLSESLPLFLSLFIFAKTAWIQIRPEWNSGKNFSSV